MPIVGGDKSNSTDFGQSFNGRFVTFSMNMGDLEEGDQEKCKQKGQKKSQPLMQVNGWDGDDGSRETWILPKLGRTDLKIGCSFFSEFQKEFFLKASGIFDPNGVQYTF